MTVQSQTWRHEYTSTGGTEYPYTFRILDESHLAVYREGVLQTLNSQYTVDGVGDAVGGTVTFAAAPTAGDAVTIVRNVPLTQLTDFVENDRGLAETKEDAADKALMISQQLQEQIDRTLLFPVESSAAHGVLPAPEIGKYLRWQATSPPTLQNAIQALSGTLGNPVLASEGGTGIDTSAATGIPSLTAGAWSIVAPETIAHGLVYNVKAHGAAGDGVTDDTAAIQACVTALAATGGVIYFPIGTYKITSAITVSVNNMAFVGEGNASKIQRSHATNNAFTVGAGVQKTRWENLTIVQDAGITATGGYGIEFAGNGILYAYIRGVILEDLFHGIGCTNTNATDRVNNVFIHQVIIWKPNGVGIYLQNSLEWFISDTIIDHNLYDSGTACIWVSTGSEAHYLSRVSCLHGEYTIRIDQRTILGGAGASAPTNMLFDTVVADNGGTACWYLHDTRLCRFMKTWASTQQGTAGGWVFEDNTRDTSLVDSIIYGCNGHGIVLRGYGHTIQANTIVGCGLAAANTYDGIIVADTYTSFLIADNTIGTYPGLAAYQRYGVAIGPTCDAFAIVGNDFYHYNNKNASAPLYYVGTGTDVHIERNITGDSKNVAAAATLTLPLVGETFIITGTTGITTITNGWAGRRITLIFSESVTVSDGSNLALAGDFAATADDTLSLVSTGSGWYETSRSVN